MRTLVEIDEINSTSRAGVSIVSITLLDKMSDVIPVWGRVRDLLGDVEADLPAGSQPPDLDDEGGSAYTVAFAVHAGAGRQTDPIILQRYAEELADVLRSVPGTDLVELHGASDEVVELAVDETALRAAGLDVSAVALAEADARNAAGSLSTRTPA